jgi:hypothetical protein
VICWGFVLEMSCSCCSAKVEAAGIAPASIHRFLPSSSRCPCLTCLREPHIVCAPSGRELRALAE